MSRLLWRCQKLSNPIGTLSLLLLHMLKKLSILLDRNNELDISRFLMANRLPFTKISGTEKEISTPKIALVVVASEKDFEVLNHTIPFGIEALGKNYYGETRVVVPKKVVEKCREMLSRLGRNDLIVLSEDDMIDETHRNMLRDKFQSRYGWALQQFLKVSQVIESPIDINMILDADTLLIHKRKWFDSHGRQILMPSWEFHSPYYKLLKSFGVGKESPEVTFITHHMIMQKSQLLKAFKKVGVKDVQGLIELVFREASSEGSAFCIEYELYGQYLWNFSPDAFFLEKWSNRLVPRDELIGLTAGEIRERFQEFASISSHDYLKG